MSISARGFNKFYELLIRRIRKSAQPIEKSISHADFAGGERGMEAIMPYHTVTLCFLKF